MISQELKTWGEEGEYIAFGSHKRKMFVRQFGDENATSAKTLLLIHGFPESSYSYHGIVDGMLKTFDRVILFDMLGYGWSDKPTKHYSYSLLEQADSVLEVWKHFNVKGGHMLSHDMGDSVATELIARNKEGHLPNWFSDGLQSATFTNGSMVLELAELRITQKMLLSSFGAVLSKLTFFSLFKHQIRSAHGNSNLTEEAIRSLWEANTLQEGHKKANFTIKYINDRKRYEKDRWLPALSQTKLPVHICWGEDDAVAKVAMAHYLKNEVRKNAQLTIMKGMGHFCQLENPDKWVESTSAFYRLL
ncbi:alpha/beta hydrolase [Flavobacteriales bacterium]|nr:alpha/beta hydrolase [Flavobacteriales bacterium]